MGKMNWERAKAEQKALPLGYVSWAAFLAEVCQFWDSVAGEIGIFEQRFSSLR